ncbi:hypothetical protein ACOMHN_018334 [Nucella lapillus]
MDSKSAPPAYSEALSGPPAGSQNAGYVAPPGDQGAPGYPPQAVGYPPPAGGYAPPPGPGGYAAQPSAPGYYGQQPQGYSGGGGYAYQQTVVMSQPVSRGMAVGTVPDHMGLAIFTTICCCWPLGLVAIMRAHESRRAVERGDVSAANTYSMEARRYSMWAIGGGIVSIVLAVVIIVVIVSSNTYAYSY